VRPSEALESRRETIRQLVEAHGLRDPRVIGSVARGEDTKSSDLDFLVCPTGETRALERIKLRQELESLLGTRVDVFTPGDLPDELRSGVLAEAKQL